MHLQAPKLKALKLSTHRVTRDDEIACYATGTIPEAGDMTFFFTEKNGTERHFRSVRIAETWAKTHQGDIP